MPWLPTIYTVSRSRVIKNLLAWIGDSTRQTESLTWAKTQLGLVALSTPNFAAIYNSSHGRIKTDFPHLMVIRAVSTLVTDEDSRGIEVTHEIGMEMELEDTVPDTLTDKADIYLTALDSVIRNIPITTTLLAGVGTTGHAEIDVTDHDRDGTRGGNNRFLQVPSLTARVKLWEV